MPVSKKGRAKSEPGNSSKPPSCTIGNGRVLSCIAILAPLLNTAIATRYL